jgi:hypothetical protein
MMLSELLSANEQDLIYRLTTAQGKETKSTIIVTAQHLKPKGEKVKLQLDLSCSKLVHDDAKLR